MLYFNIVLRVHNIEQQLKNRLRVLNIVYITAVEITSLFVILLLTKAHILLGLAHQTHQSR